MRDKTEETALFRNRFVAALADQIIITYAEPGGKTEGLLGSAVSWRKPIYTFDGPENRNIIALGGIPLQPEGAAAALERAL